MILGSLGQRSPGLNMPKPFPINNSNLVHTSILGRRGTLLILGSEVKATRVKCANIVLRNNFENKFLLHTFVQLILN